MGSVAANGQRGGTITGGQETVMRSPGTRWPHKLLPLARACSYIFPLLHFIWLPLITTVAGFTNLSLFS